MYSVQDLLAEGFPHSEICGSTNARFSPQLIAACHVLHRLLAPRHPPNALCLLTTLISPPTRRTKPTLRANGSRFYSNQLVPGAATRPTTQSIRPRFSPQSHRQRSSLKGPPHSPDHLHHAKQHGTYRSHVTLRCHSRSRFSGSNPKPASTPANAEPTHVIRKHMSKHPNQVFRGTHLTSALWRRSVSNRRPPACKAGALPTELRPQSQAASTC